MNVLLGVTGSVAATLTQKLVCALEQKGIDVRVVATQRALHFVQPSSLCVPMYTEADEWRDAEYVSGSSVLHIELREWADTLLIAPLTANTLAKMAHGMADNLLTSIVRAWDRARPMVLAPAMNTHMWEHPATDAHLTTLAAWYRLTLVPPVTKRLACGDIGPGALADIGAIVGACLQAR